MKAVITVVGKDRTGIVYHVSKILYENEVNILDLSQTIMQDYFTMMMLVDCAEMSCGLEELINALNVMGEMIGLSIKVQREDIFDAMHRV